MYRILIAFLFCVGAYAQTLGTPGQWQGAGAPTVPCVPGQVYYQTDAVPPASDMWRCNALSAWFQPTSAFVNTGTSYSNPSWLTALAASKLTATGTPSASTYLRGDYSWSSPAGSGDVVGPASAVGDNIVLFDGSTGKLIKDSGRVISTRVYLASPVTNNNASANTIADVTGLSFAVTSGLRYRFRFYIQYTSAATTTGSRWSINGPTTTELQYASIYTLTATSQSTYFAVAYDIPAASNASSLTGGNVAVIEGIIKPSANGTVIARFASEISSSAIIALAGRSFVEYEVIP